jgi:hypothetical protein
MTDLKTNTEGLAANVIVLLDLDNNIFQSERKCPEGDITPVAYKTSGEACGFMTPQQQTFFNWLSATALVIPNTARDTATFRRALLPFNSYSICSFGGVILQPDGNAEQAWHQLIAAEADQAKEILEEIHTRLLQIASARDFDIRARLVEDQGLTLYISVKHNNHLNHELVDLGQAVQEYLPNDWTVHFNDNNLAIFPQFLGKEKASSWLLANRINLAKDTVIIGSGDSFTDVAFMAQCHFALMPAKSQIFSGVQQLAANPNSDYISD